MYISYIYIYIYIHTYIYYVVAYCGASRRVATCWASRRGSCRQVIVNITAIRANSK